MIIPDLELCTYDFWYQQHFPGCVAIGWIHSDKDYKPHGVLIEEFLPALKSFLKNKENYIIGPQYMGLHECGFCKKNNPKEKKQLTRQEWEKKYNNGKDWKPPQKTNIDYKRHDNLIIEGNDKTYAIPELFLHYVEEHEYIPPVEFQLTIINKEGK